MGEVSSQQAASDLEFVRQAVERRERTGRAGVSPRWLGVMWGVILLVGCTWNDVHPRTCWMFWAVVPTVAWVMSGVIFGKDAFMMGEFDAATGRRMGMHWSTCFFGVVPLMVMAFAGKIDGYQFGQLCILVSGIVYYLGGVHFDRRWMVPGVVLMAGSAVLTFLERGGWTVVGAAACVALVVGFWRSPGKAGEAA